MKQIIVTVSLILSTLSTKAFAESAYINAWGKAYREYTRQLSEAESKGTPLTFEERKRLHKTLFAPTHEAFAREMVGDQKKMRELAVKTAREINEEFLKMMAGKLLPSKNRLAKEKDEGGPFAASPSKKEDVRQTASAESKPEASKARAPAATPASTPDAKVGGAEAVSFKAPAASSTSRAAEPKKPAEKGAAESGGAESVSFSAPKMVH